ncbi:MAG: dATP/dGTP diphosphohydrolase domain-containing protein [Candidatus Thorarchaeota archaeon]
MGETKESNPKDTVGSKKVPMHNLPCSVLLEMGLGMLDGACKYGSHNYRAVGVRASVYYDAAMRHLMSWWEGEDIDLDSGISHITKVLTDLVVLRDSMLSGNWVDDRPLRVPGGANISQFNAMAAEIVEKYPNPTSPFIEKERKT